MKMRSNPVQRLVLTSLKANRKNPFTSQVWDQCLMELPDFIPGPWGLCLFFTRYRDKTWGLSLFSRVPEMSVKNLKLLAFLIGSQGCDLLQALLACPHLCLWKFLRTTWAAFCWLSPLLESRDRI